jgi:hypothetical protein
MSDPATPISAVELKPTTVYTDAAGNHYARLAVGEAAQEDAPIRGVVVTAATKKHGETRKFAFYKLIAAADPAPASVAAAS